MTFHKMSQMVVVGSQLLRLRMNVLTMNMTLVYYSYLFSVHDTLAVSVFRGKIHHEDPMTTINNNYHIPQNVMTGVSRYAEALEI